MKRSDVTTVPRLEPIHGKITLWCDAESMFFLLFMIVLSLFVRTIMCFGTITLLAAIHYMAKIAMDLLCHCRCLWRAQPLRNGIPEYETFSAWLGHHSWSEHLLHFSETMAFYWRSSGFSGLSLLWVAIARLLEHLKDRADPGSDSVQKRPRPLTS